MSNVVTRSYDKHAQLHIETRICPVKLNLFNYFLLRWPPAVKPRNDA